MNSFTFSPPDAWLPLPSAEWNREAARHLLRRASWSAVPSEVDRAHREGLSATLDRLFPANPNLLPKPKSIAADEAALGEMQLKIAAAAPDERRVLQRQVREHSQAALLDLTIKWLQCSADPANAAYQKWILFLSDVYVVSFEKVPRAPLIYEHFDILARYGLAAAPELTKAVSRSPAMVLYLDLNQSRPGAPNENFARELFELFVLGEGNYTEADIKEAARAFTGYRVVRQDPEFYFAARQHDDGPKTIFGQTGNFDGDAVIDLAYGTRAAGAFLPHEMVKFYLSDTMIPPPYLAALGDAWKAQGYSLRWLVQRFFGSQMFYAPEFRGNFIKSPLQFYLGLVQDLQLDVLPAPRFVINPLRQMGQVLFYPPNVRGWVGGRNWINSAALAARRTMAESVFNPLREEALNQDELLEVTAARLAHRDTFTVTADRLEPLLAEDAGGAVRRLAAAFLPGAPTGPFIASLTDYLAAGSESAQERLRRTQRVAITLLESPEYQLC